MFSFVRLFCDAILGVGKQAEKSYRDYGFKKNIYNIPYNINCEKFSEKNIDLDIISKIKKEYNLTDKKIFLTSGSLIFRKGIDIVIKSFNQAFPNETNAVLLILGDGPEKDNLQKIAKYRNDVLFLGFKEKEDIPYFFYIADVFLFASRYDGWAVVINEALASNCIVIGSNTTGAVIDLIENKKNGFLFNSEDINSLSELILHVYKMESPKIKQLINNTEATHSFICSKNAAKKVHEIIEKIDRI